MNRSLTAIALTALLAACGGGSRPGVDSVAITGRAVDGPLQGAFACYDTNDNHGCDAGEPRSAATAADGSFTLGVPRAAAGRHAVVVEVPAEAVDADTAAPVGQAFVMRAPATGQGEAHSVFVSPLTTLVHAQVVFGGVSLAAAEQWVREQAGLAFSPLADFTQAGTADARQAARVARLAQLSANAQQRALAGLVGTPDRSGGTISAAVLERELLAHQLGQLPLVAGTVAEPALLAASGAALEALLQERAATLAAESGLTPDGLRAMAGMQRLAEPPQANPPVALASLRTLRYVDPDNWSFRYNPSSAADATPDANNRVRYADVRVASAPPTSASAPLPGNVRSWSGNVVRSRAGDLHWNGSAWVGCTLTDRFESTVRDALGRNSSDYCNGRETSNAQRRLEDISGQPIASVVADKIRSFPGASSGNTYASWGPADLGLYGSATFPPGSLLDYRTSQVLSTAPGYDVAASNQVALYSAAVAAGGDFRVNASLACGNPSLNTVTTAAATLEEVIGRARGQPCVFNQAGVTPNFSLNPNEAWDYATIGVGNLANALAQPVGTGNFYTTQARVRVAFAGSNRVLFYRCHVQASNGSTRNCSLIGLGTWSIQTLGDARVLSYSVAPALAQRLGYAQQLVERGGRVYYGFKSPVGAISTEVRLNLVAGNAVLRQLGLPPMQPVTQPGTATGARATTLATLQGVWGSNDAVTATLFRFGPDGRFFMAEAKAFQPTTREQSGAELGWFDLDPATGQLSTLLEVDSNLTSGTSHPGESEPPLTVSADLITDGSGFSLGRLATTGGALVGLWARNSATDLSTEHLAFFANGRVMQVQHRDASDPSCGPPGVEYASYVYLAGQQSISFSNPLYDSNGCGGLFDSTVGQTTAFATLVLAADGQSFTVGGDTWFRIPVR